MLFTYGISREKDERERSSSLAMHVVLGTCTLSAVVLHILEFRAFAYLHAPTMALLVLGLWHLGNSKRLLVPMIPALVIACTVGVYASVNRPPIQDYRGLIQQGERPSRRLPPVDLRFWRRWHRTLRGRSISRRVSTWSELLSQSIRIR